MVDFDKLRTKTKKPKPIEPSEIFRRLPKPPGINDLYNSQAEVLQTWFARRDDRDVVLKLHTGGGKTLVGLLMAQSTLNETGEPFVYLAPTVPLVNQTLEKAKAHGIPAVPYERGKPLNDDFVNGNAIMVATYNALFNGRSKFGRRGEGQPLGVSALILDDAHVAFSVVRECFTLDIKSDDDRPRYESLVGLFRRAFKDTDRLGTFDDTVSGSDYGILEVPYWAWHEQLDSVREQLKELFPVWFRDIHAPQWEGFIPSVPQFVYGHPFTLRVFPRYLVNPWSVLAWVFCHSSDGKGSAAERVGEQVWQGLHVVSLARFRVGSCCNPYPSDDRMAFAFSHPHTRTALSWPYGFPPFFSEGAIRAYHVPQGRQGRVRCSLFAGSVGCP